MRSSIGSCTTAIGSTGGSMRKHKMFGHYRRSRRLTAPPLIHHSHITLTHPGRHAPEPVAAPRGITGRHRRNTQVPERAAAQDRAAIAVAAPTATVPTSAPRPLDSADSASVAPPTGVQSHAGPNRFAAAAGVMPPLTAATTPLQLVPGRSCECQGRGLPMVFARKVWMTAPVTPTRSVIGSHTGLTL